ncbi:MAG: flagellar hook protein FlgE [Nitrospirae bacterium]|nr:flagellar hook protein FlgE [Nitrospirota bacterium]
MLQALWTAVSGMTANASAISIIGDNIANLSTTAFKSNSPVFGDVLSQLITGVTGGAQIGNGTLLETITPLFTQGTLVATGNPLDMAIDGNGFFLLRDPGAGAGHLYTRAGNFTLDKDGYLVNPGGLRVQGYLATSANATIVTSSTFKGAVTDVKINAALNTASVTSEVDSTLNLTSTATSIDASLRFRIANDANGIPDLPLNYNYSNTTTVYDSQGGAHEVTAYYTKRTGNVWEVNYVYNDPVHNRQLDIASSASHQYLVFNQSGVLYSSGTATSIATVTQANMIEPAEQFNFGTSVAFTQPITFKYGQSLAQGGNGLGSTVQLADIFQPISSTQDGKAPGSMKSVNVDQSGVITAVFSNGQTLVIGEIVLAKFPAPDKLTKIGSNNYLESFASGIPVVSAPKTSGLGGIVEGNLEQSNVDLSTQFIQMIAAQRAYTANTKTVTTIDEMMQDTLNLKR